MLALALSALSLIEDSEEHLLAPTEPFRPFRDLTPVIVFVYSTHSGRLASSAGDWVQSEVETRFWVEFCWEECWIIVRRERHMSA